jgi:hypothetical protein
MWCKQIDVFDVWRGKRSDFSGLSSICNTTTLLSLTIIRDRKREERKEER